MNRFIGPGGGNPHLSGRPRCSGVIGVLSVVLVLLQHSAGSAAEAKIADRSVDRWLGSDKFRHLAVSAFLSVSCGFVAKNHFRNDRDGAAAAGFCISLSLGGLKEALDAGRPGEHSSGKDLAADFCGAVVGAALILSLK